MTRRALITGAGVLTAGRALGQALALVRHVIVGRLLSPEDLGIAAVLMAISALLELCSQFAVDKLIVQARDGGEPGMIGTSHAFQALRGLVLSAVALAAALPVARMFGVPEAAWAFAAFSLAPLILGMRHLDSRRFHRDARFGPDMAVEVGSQVITTLAAWPAVMLIGGYGAVVWLIVIKAVVTVAASHLVAERRYALAWDRAWAGRILSFGWPLLASGVVMFLISQGDHLVVGAGYPMRTLGMYAVAAMIALAIATLISSVGSTLMLPALTARRDNDASFQRGHDRGAAALAIVAAVCGVGLILEGGRAVVALYGEAYRDAGAIIAVLGAAQCLRLVRVAPTVAALAKGDTVSSLIVNLVRVAALPAAAALAFSGAVVVWIAVAAVVAEVGAVVVVGARVSRLHGVRTRMLWVSGGASALAMAGAGAVGAVMGEVGVSLAGGLAIGAGVLVASASWFAARRDEGGQAEVEASADVIETTETTREAA